jgi:U4/U6.U5 tri-snRNP component SNU23
MVGGGSGGGVGWYCKVCDCYLKDSLTYLDHINGRKHQRALGYSMRTEKSTKQEVSSRLKAMADARKNKEAEDQIEFMVSQGKDDDDDDGMNEFEKMVKKKDEDIVKRKAERAKRREERKKKAKAEKEKAKAKVVPPKYEEEVNDEDDDDNEAGGLHPDMAAMMGFSSFGGT